eukprot:294957-Chlamydomonas_euryale.AAC.3
MLRVFLLRSGTGTRVLGRGHRDEGARARAPGRGCWGEGTRTVHCLMPVSVQSPCADSAQPLLRPLPDTAAGILYRNAGFEELKEDVWLLKLLGMDRRYLMRKRLTVEPCCRSHQAEGNEATDVT